MFEVLQISVMIFEGFVSLVLLMFLFTFLWRSRDKTAPTNTIYIDRTQSTKTKGFVSNKTNNKHKPKNYSLNI